MTLCRRCWVVFFAAFTVFTLSTAFCRSGHAEVTAIEIGAHNRQLLPKGKEADGIQGDFVLRNEHIEALIGGNLPLRRANMTTHSLYNGTGSITPGCLYDLSVRGSDNDQLTLLAPGDLRGPVSTIAIRKDGSDGQALLFVHRTAARGDGREVSHLYLLEKGWRHLLILSLYENKGEHDWELSPKPFVKGLQSPTTAQGITFADAMNPTDHQGYAWAPTDYPDATDSLDDIVLKPGQKRSFALVVAPGHSPAEAYGIVAQQRGGVSTANVRLQSGGVGVPTGKLIVRLPGDIDLPGYPNDAGDLQLLLPPGTYGYAAIDIGRPRVSGSFQLSPDNTTSVDVSMESASKIRLAIRDADDRFSGPFPCKAQFIGIAGTPNPYFGVDIQAHGCRNQYHSERGDFTVAIASGKYLVTITRGIEYTHLTELAVVKPGETTTVTGTLKRVVDTTGWVSTDFHNHSTPSGDNYCGTDDRVINLAAEHIEFAPTTEHNRLYDWAPHIEKLGLSAEISTVVGLELTGPGAHFNSFPFEERSWLQDGGAPTWQRDPRINAIVLRDFQQGGADRYVQINHPNVGKYFRDRDGDGVSDGGYRDLERFVDAAEVWSTEILSTDAWIDRRPNRTFAWLQLLNQGRMMYCIAVSDAHRVFGNGVGGWRTYIPSSTDVPSQIDYKEMSRHAKAGRMVMTNGPFLTVRLSDGTLPGGHTIASGSVQAHISVQCTDWIDIDRVQILVNGRQPSNLNFTREKHPKMFSDSVVKFDHHIEIPFTVDAHIIVAAVGEGHNLQTGYGESWQSEMHPVAFTNPIFVDFDGNGFRANGDNIGQPLPLGKQP